jgi:hypothetical protein
MNKPLPSYNYNNSGHFLSHCLLLKTQSFEDWIQSPSFGGTYLVGPIYGDPETEIFSIHRVQV